MGVSGSGKSTLGKLVGDMLDLPFFDGDDYHSDANIKKMASGIPLDDKDREGWLESLCVLIREENSRERIPVLACSALKPAYRNKLRGAAAHVFFVHLTGSRALLARRIEQRSADTKHYMKGTMLDSQLEALDDPASEPDALTVQVTEAPKTLAEKISQYLQTKLIK